ncbi:MAG: hypothetical protein P1Q69_02295 [Candidatus Thorarchaeota archaeon]|nr:hypothetical protein [Candidatus Thorarchaeota archaeon]
MEIYALTTKAFDIFLKSPFFVPNMKWMTIGSTNNSRNCEITDIVFVFILPSESDIDAPPDFEYLVGTTGNDVTWALLNGITTMIQILRVDSLIISTVWSGSDYTLNVDHLVLGNYNFTAVVWDAFGDSDSDSVWVSVVEELTTTDTTTSTTDLTNTTIVTTEIPEWFAMFSFVITIGSSVIVVVVIVIIYRSRTVTDYGFEYS